MSKKLSKRPFLFFSMVRIVHISRYFAYGSNMNPARMRARGLHYTSVQGGRLTGFALRFNKLAEGKQGVGYANIIFSPGSCVEGLLYELPGAEDIVLMDSFEGTPCRYSREAFTIATAGGCLLPAWVYIANPAWIDQHLHPEEPYLAHLLAGKEWHSPEYHEWLCAHKVLPGPAFSSSQQGLTYNV